MIKYMLDTNICIYIIKKKPISVIQKLQTLKIDEIGITSITLSEMEYGVNKSSKPSQNKLALLEFISTIEILNFDDNAANEYGKIRTDLENKGTPIGSLDTLIAAHAKSINCILVTNNEKEFKRVKGLVIENWVAKH